MLLATLIVAPWVLVAGLTALVVVLAARLSPAKSAASELVVGASVDGPGHWRYACAEGGPVFPSPKASALPPGGPSSKRVARLASRISLYHRVELGSRKIARLAPTTAAALLSVMDAMDAIDEVYLVQAWRKNPKLREYLVARLWSSPPAWRRYLSDELEFFDFNKGPFDKLEDRVFVKPLRGVVLPPSAPPGSGLYPPFMMTRMDVGEWLMAWEEHVASLGEDASPPADPTSPVVALVASSAPDAVAGVAVRPYSRLYARTLSRAAAAMRAAARHVRTPELVTFLHSRAAAFMTNNYAASEADWLAVPFANAEFVLVIGPYSKYGDQLASTKRAFKAVPTASNLPSPGILKGKHGSIRLILANVLKAKYVHILKPGAKLVYDRNDAAKLSFESFMLCVVYHELYHGLGPKRVSLESSPHYGKLINAAMGPIHSPLEEAKANIGGFWGLLRMLRRDPATLPFPDGIEDVLADVSIGSVCHTFVASLFRSMRFGLHEAHGRAAMLQFHFLLARGAITTAISRSVSLDSIAGVADAEYDSDDSGLSEDWKPTYARTSFKVHPDKLYNSAYALLGEIIAVQAAGDTAAGAALLDEYASSVAVDAAMALEAMARIPTDIRPDYSNLRSLLRSNIASAGFRDSILSDDDSDTDHDSDSDSDDGEDHDELSDNSGDDDDDEAFVR
ncbi:uncharacterized protein AMSG_10931 [Thecamonas trahens ATCC 50062]|uniref:Uncharacterized protein n=1 Tax=Thecamonas trahens ATCC 50062 TaxID=461836 RepID=A0A0L0DSP3_THETB|nr:hypothetical protein AMSG_10931 [Thecamonas trahens ATCC 50062]KNC55290.1 hypothetical protein AMSG_10931 [Thecamonas trahens ATCC 50062]|eukprot:XP_013753111.1 hypothetical protein AMSG_10931 [Thecamonas trahens ATCC 50062]